MRVYFVQHGEAMEEKDDPKRPLSEKGRLYANRIACVLSASGLVHIGKVFHSGKLRALQTAEIFASSLGVPDKIFEIKGITPLDSPATLIDTLKAENENVMVVGHLPNLGKAVSYMLGGDGARDMTAFNFSGVICLERNREGAWQLAPLLEK